MFFDSSEVETLSAKYPDSWWEKKPAIQIINEKHPLRIETKLQHPGAVYAAKWSNDGTCIATVSTIGTIRIWDAVTFKLLLDLRDPTEIQIDEFFVCEWTPDDSRLFVGGKLKNRHRWSDDDDDNSVLPCPIKSFAIKEPTSPVKVFNGHKEEILCLKLLKYKNKNFMLSSSQDGYLIKWQFDSNWDFQKKSYIDDESTSIAISIAFFPECGNRYFACSGDHAVKVYDFENERVSAKYFFF